MAYDQETIDRFNLVAKTRVCPDCGQDVKQSTLGEVLASTGMKPEKDDVLEAVAYVCTHPDCDYSTCINELPEVAQTGT